ncbi:homing endonuclease associated repeat-containing protein [Paenibacillus silvae]|uniref:Uncharacterized protein n=1 Tax=Paenibacillus silvae TaxID=1325358 RepID=A0A2W6NNY8_9BACL|nr:hypothetical protein [Paenibacillus silvae]PZT57504.1 hypothetical protein DN757_02290 [Paenibacillus silvae]
MIFIHKEIELRIIEDYKNGIKPKDICEKYNVVNFYNILNKYKVQRFNKKWTQEELDILQLSYPCETWEMILKLIPKFSKSEITQKASRMGISRDLFQYTDEDIEVFKKHYGTMSVKSFIDSFFPNKSESAILTKANRLGLKSREHWSDDENNILFKHYSSITNKELKHKFLNNRTLTAITCQATNLGLKKTEITNIQFSKNELIENLLKLSSKLGRTPTCDDLLVDDNAPSPSTYHRYFGSYSNACLEAGLKVNPINTFGNTGFHEASDGTLCLSAAEVTITEFLIENDIKFQKEVMYSDIIDDERCGKKRCDWLLCDGTVIEYFGMPERESYKLKMKQKIELCKDNKIKLIALYRKDLNKLHKIFKPLTNVSTVTTKR